MLLQVFSVLWVMLPEELYQLIAKPVNIFIETSLAETNIFLNIQILKQVLHWGRAVVDRLV
jgi:hypothetical protein